MNKNWCFLLGSVLVLLCGCCIFSALLSSEAYRGSGQTYSDQPDGCDAGLCDMRAFGILGSDRFRRLRYVLCLHEKPGCQKVDGSGSCPRPEQKMRICWWL